MPRATQRLDMTPGYYQGRQQGLKSGRTSPRDAIRPSRSDLVDAAHGIVSTGSIDPHQGQLFDTRQMPAVPADQLVRRAGGAAYDRLADHKGFMPGLDTHRQKVAAIHRLAAARTRTGADRDSDTKDYSGAQYKHAGEPLKSGKPAKKTGIYAGAKKGAPVREAMEDRAAVIARGSDHPWYASRTAEGHLGPGEAGELISGVAARQNISQGRAIRAVAITSPRTAWDDQNAGPVGHSAGLSRPNINSAEAVISTMKGLGADPLHERIVEATGGIREKALGRMMTKAGVEYAKGEPNRPIPVSGKAAAKVLNFEQGLHLDNPSRAVQAQAARSYTVDVHDTKTFGGDEQMLKTPGGYHIAAMLGRRASLKAGMLGPMGQGSSWGVMRGQDAPESMGQHGMFRQTRSGNIIPQARALPNVTVRRTLAEGGTDDRSDFAKKMGIEF